MYLLPLDLVSKNQLSTNQNLYNARTISWNDRWTCITIALHSVLSLCKPSDFLSTFCDFSYSWCHRMAVVFYCWTLWRSFHCFVNKTCSNDYTQYFRRIPFEPSHDKTNKMACAPIEDQIRLGWSVFAVHMKKAMSYPLSAQRSTEDNEIIFIDVVSLQTQIRYISDHQ